MVEKIDILKDEEIECANKIIKIDNEIKILKSTIIERETDFTTQKIEWKLKLRTEESLISDLKKKLNKSKRGRTKIVVKMDKIPNKINYQKNKEKKKAVQNKKFDKKFEDIVDIFEELSD